MFRTLLLATSCAAVFVYGAIAAEGDGSPDELVRAALKHEGTSVVAGRRELLRRALDVNSDHGPARWHSGFLKDGDTWRTVEDAAKAVSAESVVVEYRKQRASEPENAAGHVRLAEWCRRHDLPLRERAHLWAAVSYDRGSLSAAQSNRLKQLAATQETHRAPRTISEKSSRRWQSFANQLLKKWKSRRGEIRRQADEELATVHTFEALPAFEALFTDAGPVVAKRFVEHLQVMRTHDAGFFLAKQAVHSPYSTVREIAAQGLRNRSIEEYVPALMESLSAPIQMTSKVYSDRRGVHLALIMTQERQDSRRVFALSSNVNLKPRVQYVSGRNRRFEQTRNRTRYQFAQNNVLAGKSLQADAIQRQGERANEKSEEMNQRVFAALKGGTGLRLPSDEGDWWRWWAEYNQMPTDYDKPIEYITRVESSSVDVPMTMPHSCFVAGTQVWTDRGKISVENVKVGDLALSRDPQSGELAFRPVLRTTVRPPIETIEVSFGDESFQVTGSHVFWVAGRGWTRARDLKAGQWLHAAADPVQITRVASSQTAEAFNLIVADFHTYFVGDAKVLSHDPLFAKPLDAHVPGLPTLH